MWYNFPMAKNITFDQPVAELIKKRVSCRSFDGRGLESKMLEALEKFPAGLELPFQSRLRFGIIDREKVKAESMFSTGSYGMIKGVRFYLSALVQKDAPRPWEDIGFALEATVLFATALDLGSCWIGGIFDRKNFGKVLDMGADELLPAVVAVGRPDVKRSLRDRLVRWSAKGNLRKGPAGLFFAGDWQTPLIYEELPQWAPVLECVRLAPSASNKQPWRIIFQDKSFHFYLNRDRAYSALMPKADLQRIDMGIAICHFQLAAAEAGLNGEWSENEPQVPGTPVNYEYITSFVI
ncbi:MAG TPA: nitroreductase family protein [Patescibacteria group bacterium]|nr:nitroreductase family protein [Patescibacteria group bacterium]